MELILINLVSDLVDLGSFLIVLTTFLNLKFYFCNYCDFYDIFKYFCCSFNDKLQIKII